MKTRDLKTVIVDCVAVNYFYTRERNDVNGNPRFMVYILDPEAPAVYEIMVKTYEGLICDYVKQFVREAASA